MRTSLRRTEARKAADFFLDWAARPDATEAFEVKGLAMIVGTLPAARLTDLQPFWQRLRARTGLKDVRIHDLRHTFASAAVASGQGLPMIGKLLRHTQVQTTARYTHLAADPIKSAADSVSSTLQRAMG